MSDESNMAHLRGLPRVCRLRSAIGFVVFSTCHENPCREGKMRLLASSRSYAHRSGIDVYVQSDVRSDTLSHGLPPLTLQIVAFGRSVCGSAHLGAQRTI